MSYIGEPKRRITRPIPEVKPAPATVPERTPEEPIFVPQEPGIEAPWWPKPVEVPNTPQKELR